MSFEKEKSSHPINSYGKPAPHGKGLGAKGIETFKPTGGKNNKNAGGQASRQDGVNTKKDTTGKESIWKHEDSEQRGENFPGA